MRCFLGLPVTGTLRRQLQGWCGAGATASMRWEMADDWHLTLVFLGHTDSATLDLLAPAVGGICVQSAAIHQPLAGPAPFPHSNSPILALEGEAVAALLTLHERLQQACTEAGLTLARQEQRFRPHVTLTRARTRGTPLPPPAPLQLDANEVVLYSSERPDGEGRRYRPVARWPLAGQR
ncbi:hypothetical protein S7S_09700 [Isoalcanivorax pacificus W11-5]|jgi:RNA 2',3'-cyclic 3'-phosphodiesterase|uniref:RNA 2',3'-cyclic phosphodiesterase n=1 Tax=Isoalcanivorax pacificus W11-5 TaxID=391936 RepID=A0A0B4XQ14_9GAMM|nr:RNA 2',3'-cyclic phosphodiesterase [Isoalcanivorax pacificus]AJD48352.1 hypothetical protein S7S_09700 [Isoalcanivorax pacificus W11-5]